MHPSKLQIILWGSGAVLDFLLCALVIWRRLYRHLPVFSVYAGLLLPHEISIYLVYRFAGYTSLLAFYSFWTWQAVLIAFRALAIGELAWSASRLYPGFRVVLKWLLGGLAVLFLLVTGIIAVTGPGRLPPLILGLERDLNLTAVAVLLGMYALSRTYDVMWDFPRKLIAVGFFIYSALQVVNDAVLLQWLRFYFPGWNLVRVAAFHIARLCWLAALARTLPSETPAAEVGEIEALGELVRAGNDRLRQLSARITRLRKAWRP